MQLLRTEALLKFMVPMPFLGLTAEELGQLEGHMLKTVHRL